MSKKFVIMTGVIIVTILCIFTYCHAFREPEAPGAVKDVLEEYARRFPQGRVDHAGRIGDRFFIGIIVFPQGKGLDVRYVLVGKFREWEPIAEFKKMD